MKWSIYNIITNIYMLLILQYIVPYETLHYETCWCWCAKGKYFIVNRMAYSFFFVICTRLCCWNLLGVLCFHTYILLFFNVHATIILLKGINISIKRLHNSIALNYSISLWKRGCKFKTGSILNSDIRYHDIGQFILRLKHDPSKWDCVTVIITS